jgi:hypothetical protein
MNYDSMYGRQKKCPACGNYVGTTDCYNECHVEKYRIVFDEWNSRIEKAETERKGDGEYYTIGEAKHLLKLFAENRIQDFKLLKKYAKEFKP